MNIFMEAEDTGAIPAENLGKQPNVDRMIRNAKTGLTIKAIANAIKSLSKDDLDTFLEFIDRSEQNGAIDVVKSMDPNLDDNIADTWRTATKVIIATSQALESIGQL